MRRRYKRRTGIGFVAIMVLCICSIVLYKRVALSHESEVAKAEIEKLESELKEEQDRTTEIKNLEAYMQTNKYVEDVARTKLGLVYKDEKLFKKTE